MEEDNFVMPKTTNISLQIFHYSICYNDCVLDLLFLNFIHRITWRERFKSITLLTLIFYKSSMVCVNSVTSISFV